MLSIFLIYIIFVLGDLSRLYDLPPLDTLITNNYIDSPNSVNNIIFLHGDSHDSNTNTIIRTTCFKLFPYLLY